MFKSKYVFETRSTRNKRRLLVLLGFFCLLISMYMLCSVIMVYNARQITQESSQTLGIQGPDLIVTFTGHSGRIPYSINLANRLNQHNLYISGVFRKNTVDSLLRDYKIKGLINPNFLEIDYKARNTIENVLSTYRYLRANPGIRKVVIVSNDYHITRINLLTEMLRRSEDHYEFYYMGMDTNFSSIRNLKILFKEVFKLVRALIFVLLWNY